MRKLILFLLVFVSAKVSAQVYQEMPQYGYRANRMAFDSTLQIPTVCGVPTLKSVVKTNKNGAIAYDSCNAIFYAYNPKTLTWTAITGGGGGSTDTTSLSNRINLKIDSLKRSNDSVYAYRNGTRVFQFKDSVGGGGNFWKTSGTTTLSGADTIVSDNGTLVFIGGSEDMARFSVQANNIDIITSGGDLKIIGLDALNDTTNYKPLVRNLSTGAIEQSTSWVSGGGASDTSKVVIAQVHNATATTLTKGEVVYLFGSTGNIASVKRANNKQDSTSSKTIGLVRRDIPAGGTGFITTQGQIEKLNLGSYVEGDVLWLDSLDGQFTKVKPQAPYHSVFIGVVERANNGNGLAYIKPQNGVELDEVHDVQINNLINNQIIVYSDTQQVWKNRNIYSVVDTTSLSNRINLKQNSALTSYSFIANNTNATANGTAQNFKDTSGVYTQSPAWNGVAPTTLTATYRWTRIGKRVDLNIVLVYSTAGSSNSTLTLPLPSDAPNPAEPSGATSNSNFMYPAYGMMNTNLTTLTNAAFRGGIRKNSGGTGYEFHINFTGTPTTVYVNTTYWTN